MNKTQGCGNGREVRGDGFQFVRERRGHNGGGSSKI